MFEFSDTAINLLDIIKSKPGIHFRGLVEESNRQVGVVKHHLRSLEKKNIIISIGHRNNLLYFDALYEEKIDEVKDLINYLRKTIPREIILIVSTLKKEFISLKQIAETLKRSPSSLHWHIKRMIEDGIIYPVRKGRQVSVD